MHLRITTAIAALALFAATAPAYAQDNPENGDTGQWQQPNNGQQQGQWGGQQNQGGTPPQGGGQWGQQNQGQQQGQWGNQGGNQGNQGANQGGTWGQDNEHAGAPHGQAGSTEPAANAGENGQWTNDDNHLGAFHRLGVGFFGIDNIPIGSTTAVTTIPTVAAPTIGIRYWLNELVGLEAAFGLGFGSATASSGSTSMGLGSTYGIAFHIALPLALAHWKHFAFIAQPEIEVGFSGGSVPGAASFNGSDDLISGFLFRVGGRIGAEIHMGFIGIPQLSLQAGIGLHLAYSSAGSDVCQDANCNMHASGSVNTIGIGTSIEKNPWDWFTGNITAIYYL